jgi:hypothetical protein
VYRRRPVSAEFSGPGGLISVAVDRMTGLRAGPLCPADRITVDFFIAGTEPTQECDGTLMGPMGDSLRIDSAFVLPTGQPMPKPKRPASDTANPFRLP